MGPLRFLTKRRLFKRRMEVEIDSETISLYKKKRLFFCKEMEKFASFPLDRLIYWGNNNDINSSKWLWVCEDGTYDSLPTSISQEASDDKDDWLFASLANNTLNGTEDDSDLDADLYMQTSTTRLKLGSEQISKIYSLIKGSEAVKATVRYACGLLPKQYIAYTDKWLFHLKKDEVDSTPLKEMAFFVRNKKNLYCGYHRQINVKILNSSLFKELKDLCYSKSIRLSAQGTTYKAGIIHPDIITITDNAIAYTRKTFRKDEMAYVPFKRVNMLFCIHGLLRKRISVFGEQNIIPKHAFWRGPALKIIDVLKQHGLNITTGKTYCSARIFPHNWFGRAPRIVCLEDSIVYYPNRISGEDNNLKSMMLKYSQLDEITWYKKYFTLFGTLELKGQPENIRNDQSTPEEVPMVIPELFKFKYQWWFIFSGKLKKLLMNETSATFKTVRRKRNKKEE